MDSTFFAALRVIRLQEFLERGVLARRILLAEGFSSCPQLRTARSFRSCVSLSRW